MSPDVGLRGISYGLKTACRVGGTVEAASKPGGGNSMISAQSRVGGCSAGTKNG